MAYQPLYVHKYPNPMCQFRPSCLTVVVVLVKSLVANLDCFFLYDCVCKCCYLPDGATFLFPPW